MQTQKYILTYYVNASLTNKNASFDSLESADNQYQCFDHFVSTFTGKEKDSETGFCYFGARYYDSDLSGIFLSVDPMSDKYPSISPYAYCAWNPVKLVDPDGRDTAFAGSAERELYNKYRDIVFSDDKYTQIQKELTQLEQAKEVFCIRMGDNLSNKEGSGNFIYNLSTGQFDVNISNDDTWTDMEKISHELKHADQYLNRKLTFLISVSGIVTIEDYSVDDEIEAFNRQSMFGKSLSYNEIHNAYPELNHYGKNSSFIPTQEYIIINTTYNQGKKHPYKLYHGWENDLIK